MSDGPEPTPASGSAAPVATPVMGSRLLTVEHSAWSVLGTAIGPSRSTVLRLTVTLGAGCVVERVDGRPLGDLAERCRDQIEAARLDLEERLRRGGTATHARTAQPATRPGADQRTTSSVFRCERQVITDRITRLRQDTRPPAPTPPAPADDEQRARDRLAEIRAAYWSAQQAQPADELLPSPAPDQAEPTAEPRKHTTSVFRVDREAITDRIGRLRRRPDGSDDITPAP